jgi:hypothetical protein
MSDLWGGTEPGAVIIIIIIIINGININVIIIIFVLRRPAPLPPVRAEEQTLAPLGLQPGRRQLQVEPGQGIKRHYRLWLKGQLFSCVKKQRYQSASVPPARRSNSRRNDHE